MRLSQNEARRIIEVLSEGLGDVPHQVFLLGSRVDDLKKGGDIDLLLKVSMSDFEKVRAQKMSLKFDLEEAVGDQRVDLTLATEETLNSDIFLKSIVDELVQL